MIHHTVFIVSPSSRTQRLEEQEQRQKARHAVDEKGADRCNAQELLLTAENFRCHAQNSGNG